MMFLTELCAPTSPWAGSAVASEFRPTVDFYETAESFLIRLELAGIDPETIDLTLTNGELTIKGTKPALTVEETTVHLRESTEGTFERTFAFPTKVTEIAAESKFGVLEVKVAKAPEAVARKISITVS